MNLQRMRHALATAGLALILSVTAAAPARAALLNANPPQTFPDISSDIVGQLTYTYNPSAGVGTLDVTNSPSILATGPSVADESYIYDNGSQTRSQSLQVQLDANGNIVANSSGNTYSLYGSVTVNGQTYSGLLLQGTPIAFGWQPPQTPPIGSSAFDVEVKVTGGLLQAAYGADAYIQLTPELNSTFNNSFTTNFSAEKAITNVRPVNPPSPSPLPEPSTFATLLVCVGAAAAYRGHRRLARPV